MTVIEQGSPDGRSRGRGRQVLAGLALVLACLGILVSTVAVWTHQVALNTDRFTALVSDALDEPAIIDPLADRISTQIVTALDVQGRIAAQLPAPAEALAAPITLAIRDGIDKRLQAALVRPNVQAGLTRVVAFTHARIMNLLRSDPEAVTVEDGYIVVEVFPVVEAALEELQSIGLLPAGVQIPDLSSPDAPDVLAGRLESALGITLPPDFGTVRLMQADRLLAARAAVKAFDILVVVLVVVTILLIALALWLSRSRLRMVIYLGIGSVIAFALAKLAINSIVDAALAGVADADLVGAIRVVVDATLADLRSVTTIVLLAAAILVILALAVVIRGSSDGPDRDRRTIERVGLVGIVFVILWLSVGLDVALLAGALIIALGLIVGAFAPAPAPMIGEPVEPA